MRLFRISGMALLALVAGLVCAAGVSATVIGLPFVGSQVSNDPVNGIDPNQDAGLSDVVGGSLTVGGSRVPWATFEQQSGSSQQIFVRAFKNGQWVTQGRSLNIDPKAVAEAPSVDFAGAGRAVPWEAWYEPSRALGGEKQIFASRFGAAANTWVPEGQDRGSGVPSLNIHTGQEAENPSVAGGAGVPGNDPVPWVAWQEQDGDVNHSGSHDQIFVSKGVKQAALQNPCTGSRPSAAASVGAFCWQQVGADRLGADGGSGSNRDPSLNVDPSRDGIEPDITFTGPSDKVAWTVWYEVGDSHLGLRNNDQVFAAKIVADNTADGGFHWQAVGNETAGQANPLDTSSNPPGFGSCATSRTAEDQCSLNAHPQQGAEDPRVATGTLTPASATVPWVVWAEDTGNAKHAIFISRLVNGDHFQLFNGGQPVSPTSSDATHPDITFLGNVPYVSWIEARGDGNRGFVGHFENGVFGLDTPDGIRLSPHDLRASLIDARVPLSSNCTADPFTNDGQACQVAAVNAPFDLFTTAGSPQRLFSQAIIGGPNCMLFRSCKLSLISAVTGVVIQGNLTQSNSVGILVQRILATRRVHGKQTLVLRSVGRVPLGHHPTGQLKIRWNLKVNGHRLARGRYLITLRAFDHHQNLLGHTNPVTLTVKH